MAGGPLAALQAMLSAGQQRMTAFAQNTDEAKAAITHLQVNIDRFGEATNERHRRERSDKIAPTPRRRAIDALAVVCEHVTDDTPPLLCISGLLALFQSVRALQWCIDRLWKQYYCLMGPASRIAHAATDDTAIWRRLCVQREHKLTQAHSLLHWLSAHKFPNAVHGRALRTQLRTALDAAISLGIASDCVAIEQLTVWRLAPALCALLTGDDPTWIVEVCHMISILATHKQPQSELVGGGATVNLSKMLKQMSKISNDLQWVALALINLYHSDTQQSVHAPTNPLPAVLQRDFESSMLTGGIWRGSVMTAKGSPLEYVSWVFQEQAESSSLTGRGVKLTSEGSEDQHELLVQLDSQRIHVNRMHSALGSVTETGAANATSSSVLYSYVLKLTAIHGNERHMFGTWHMGSSCGIVHFVSGNAITRY